MLLPIILTGQNTELDATGTNLVLDPIAFHNLTVDQGLSQNSIVSIAQDSIGYMWFATQDGLNKYDGKRFKIYNKQFEDVTKITHSKLGKVYSDKTNQLWIISNSGNLEKFNVETDSFRGISNIKNVSTIFQDNSHNYFIGTFGNGLYHINEKSKDTTQIIASEDRSKTTYAFLEDKDTIFATTSNSVLKISKYDLGYRKIASNIDDPVNYSCTEQLSDGRIWIGSYSYGLFYLDENHTKLHRFKGFKNQPLPTNLNIEAILADKHQRLWLATYGRGVYIIDFKRHKIDNYTVQQNNPYALHYNDALSLFEDNTGNIWVGTDGGGLSYYDEHLLKFNVLTNNQLPQDISVDVARAICVNPKNSVIWVGTSGKGLTSIDLKTNTYKTITTTNSNLNSNRVMCLNFVSDELWVGFQDSGLDIINGNGSIDHFNENTTPGLSTNAVWCILKEDESNMWLATGGQGLILFNKKEGIKENYLYDPTDNNSISSDNIRVITKGKSDELWIGTEDNGLCQLNTKTKKIKRINGIPDKIKSLLWNNHKMVLWVGTNGGGLIKYNPASETVTHYTTVDGLPNNVIYGILPDKNNNLWLSSNRGITMFSETDSEVSVSNYDQYDGLQAFEFNTGAYTKDDYGMLYFGGLDGINWFKPEQLTLNQVKPKTIISGLSLYNEAIAMEENQRFSHKENSLTFSFASLHFSQPELNTFKYMLVGHDKDWIEAGNNNTAYYGNLSPEAYTFKVISSNYDGIWNETPATYSFTIQRAWYNTLTARIIYACLALLLGIVIYRYIKWRWHIKTQLQLEHAETQRLKNLDEFKTRLFTNISHEFRTPLTLILGPAKNQLARSEVSKENKEELSLIKHNAERLLNLVDQLIDLAKLETGYSKLKVERGNLAILINQLTSSFKYQIEQKRIKFKSNIDEIENAWYDKDVIEKIMVNLLANAIKYTPKKGYIVLKVVRQDGHLVITILNNGSKIDPKDINQLFNRFYQINPNADGVGIGLALVKELVSLAKGSILANSINKDDIQFTVTLPIEKSAFEEHDISEVTNIKDEALSIDDSDETNAQGELTLNHKPIVLVVEDNSQLRSYIQSILKPKYKILKAPNGKKGLEKAIENVPDLIISDIMMPEMNGIELCNALKTNTLTSHIPFILLTAKTGESNELEGLEVGADDFITKPFNSKILLKRIENLITLSKSLQKRYTQHSVLKPKDIAITNLDEIFIKQLEEVLKAHLDNPEFNAQSLSKQMAMSRMQLHRKIVALTGLSTSQFLRSQRLKSAVALLNESDLTVSEVAYQVGFNSVSYFIKCFKEAYNTTPNAYNQR
ncbi:two-component regulator propeller domain-containing protein [Hyunsoonleella aquatilis]|uniref:two-component regulator propeller domain-containing protein n=1 Tax=Hyunsoonleella aquatilis TaxID=2762758 RepID=UPI003CCCF18D